jgi:transposase
MRGDDTQQGSMWSYPSPERRVPQDHPLRPIRVMVDAALKELSPRFALLYSHTGRPSIPPEQLLRALLLQVLFTVRSERQLMEQLDYNLLFRWFVGLGMDDPVWDPTVFTKNRDRLLAGDVAQAFFDQVLAQAKAQDLLSPEHFTVDGTLLEAWAGQKSFQAKTGAARPPDDDPGKPTVDFRGEVRTNATHASTTDPDARLIKKAPDNRPNWPTRATSSWRIAMGSWCGRPSPGPRGPRSGRPPWPWRPPFRAPTASPSAPTRRTTRRPSSPPAGRSASCRMSRSTFRGARAPSTAGPPGTPAMG